MRHSRDLNDCWGGQGKFEVRIKYCAVWKKQTCLLVSLRAILSQREAQNREYIISKGKLESSGEKTYNSTRVSIRFRRTVILQEQAPVCPPKWLRERNGNDAITRKVMKNALQSAVHTTANIISLHCLQKAYLNQEKSWKTGPDR